MFYFIVNPGSRSGKAQKIWEQAEDMLQEYRVQYECFFLEKSGRSAGQIAAELYANARPCTIVVVGGDGTLNEVISGLPAFDGITLSSIPTGSGNDFARGMHLPRKPRDCVRMLLNSTQTAPINIAVVSSSSHGRRCFAVSSGMGFDAAICRIAEDSAVKRFLNRLHLGQLVYPIGALQLLMRTNTMTLRVLVDDAQLIVYEHVFFAAVMNLPYEGGGFCFCPHADPQDDELDLIVAAPDSKAALLRLLLPAKSGRHIGKEGIHTLRLKKAAFLADAPQCVHTDGEAYADANRVQYALHPEKLHILIPQSANDF